MTDEVSCNIRSYFSSWFISQHTQLLYIAMNERTGKHELETMWTEAVMSYSGVLSSHLSGWTELDHKNLQSQ